MPEIRIKYKNPKVKEALIDFSKYLDFIIVGETPKTKAKKVLLSQITKGLTEFKISDRQPKRHFNTKYAA